MEEARVPIPIVGGIDDSTDPLALRPPNLATSENTRIIRTGAVSKRPAWGGVLRSGGTTALIADGDDRVLVLDDLGGAVVDSDGVAVSPANAAPLPLEIDRVQIAPGRGYVHSVQAAASENYVCVAWSQIGRVNGLESGAGDDVVELDSEIWAVILDANLRLRWGPHRMPTQLRWLPRIEPQADGTFAVFAAGLGSGWIADAPFDGSQDTELYASRYAVDASPGAAVFLGDLVTGHYNAGLGGGRPRDPYRIYDTATTYVPGGGEGMAMVAMNRRDGGTRYMRFIAFTTVAGLPTDVACTNPHAHSMAVWWDAPTSTVLVYDAGDELVHYLAATSGSVAAPDLIEVYSGPADALSAGSVIDTGYDFSIGPYAQNPHFYRDANGQLYLNERPVTLTGTDPGVPSFGSAETERLPQIYEPAVLGSHTLFAHAGGGNPNASFKVGASDVTLYYIDAADRLAPTGRLGETRHGDPGHAGYSWDTNSVTARAGACVGGQVATIGGALLYPMALQARLQNPRGTFANPVYDDTAAPALYNASRNAYSGAGYYNDEQVVSLVRVALSARQHSVVRFGQSSLVAAGAVSLWTGDRAVVPVAIPRPYFASISGGENLPSSEALGIDPASDIGTGEVKFNGLWALRVVLVGTTPDGLQIRSPVSNRHLVNLPNEDDIPTNAFSLIIEPHPSMVAMLDAGLAIDAEVYATNRGEAGGAGEPAFDAFGDLDESTYTLVSRAPLQQTSAGAFFAVDLMQDFCRYATDTLGWGIPTEVPPRRALALYTVSGELEPLIPPASQVMAQAGEYVFLLSAEEPTELWYSKPLVPGRVPEFNPLLSMALPPEAGRCVSLATTYDRLYLLCERGVWELPAIGGPDSTGSGSFPPPRLVYRGNPCVNHMGTVSTPAGVFYVTTEGPRLIGQDGSFSEPGNAVADQLDWSAVVGAVFLDTEDEVIWFDSDYAAVLSLTTGAWSTVDLLTAAAGRMGNALARVNQAGVLRLEDATSVLDGAAYPLATVTTGWVDLGDPQGYKRFNEITLLGRLENTPTLGTLLVKIAYDYDDTVVDTFTWNWTDVPRSATNTFQLEVHPTVSKVDSMKITVTEGTTTVGQTTGNDALWTLAGIEARVRGKRGLTKQPAEGKK